jgi:hypothetical protein
MDNNSVSHVDQIQTKAIRFESILLARHGFAAGPEEGVTGEAASRAATHFVTLRCQFSIVNIFVCYHFPTLAIARICLSVDPRFVRMWTT